MSARGFVVRDGRQTSSIHVERLDLAVLAERAEHNRLIYWRSIYLALLEQNGSRWTKKELAARAGVGASTLNEVLKDMERAGVIVRYENDDLQLGGGKPSTEEQEVLIEAEPVAPPPPDERAERFFQVYAERVEPVRGDRPRRDPDQIAAARKILNREADALVIMNRLEFALGHRFYADKVLKMTDFERWWMKVNAACIADQKHEQRTESRIDRKAPEADPNWTGTDYESDTVKIV